MLVSSLFHLASKAVAKGIHEDTISIGRVPDTKSSNAVFEELLLLDPYAVPNLEGLSISEMDFKHVPAATFESIIPNLKKFNLTSLSLGDLGCAHELAAFKRDSVFNVVDLLRNAANGETRKRLRHLGLSGEETFGEGWELTVSRLFPSLVSIDISSKQFSDIFKFPDFCLAFLNLRHLDISSTNLQNLNGIENLWNLEKLVMCDVRVADLRRLDILSELGNLRYLDVSSVHTDRRRVISIMLRAGVCMKNLEFLDCSRTLIGDEELKQFVKTHPTLKTVVAIGIDLDQPAPPGIHLIGHATPSSTVECVEYSISMEKYRATYECLLRISVDLQNHKNSIRTLEETSIRNYLISMLEMMQNSRVSEHLKLLAFKCVRAFLRIPTIRLFTSFEDALRMLIIMWKNSGRLKPSTTSMLFDLLEEIACSRTPGQLIPTDILNVMLSGVIDLLEENPNDFDTIQQILSCIGRTLSWDQSLEVSPEIVRKFFELAERMVAREKYGSVRVILTFIYVHLKRAVKSRRDLVTSGIAGRLCKTLGGLKMDETIAMLEAMSKVLRNLMIS